MSEFASLQKDPIENLQPERGVSVDNSKDENLLDEFSQVDDSLEAQPLMSTKDQVAALV